MSRDTFHIEFNTKSFPGKIESVEVVLRRHITGDTGYKYRLDMRDHPLYRAVYNYCMNNPPRSSK